MSLPRLRVTVRVLMAAVAVAAIVTLAVSRICRDYPRSDQRAAVLVASLFAGAYGLGAMRRPWIYLATLLVIGLCAPATHDPGLDVRGLSAVGCVLGWAIGAPVGWISRWRRGPGDPRPAPRVVVDQGTAPMWWERRLRFTLRDVMAAIGALAVGLAFPPLLVLMLVVGAGFLTALLAVPVFLAVSRVAGPPRPPDGKAGVGDRLLE